MPELINWTRSPLVVTGEDGKRITIEPGKSKPVNGNFSNHPWVKKGRLEIVGSRDSGHVQTEGDEGGASSSEDPERLRLQYQNIFGKPPHKNAAAATIQKKIDEWKSQSE